MGTKQCGSSDIDLAFVILQYMASDDTAACVQSIRSHAGTEEYRIIIVDNASPDDSYENVRRTFEGSDDVILLRNDENLGFARGNNVGYRYAMEHLRPQYIVMLNNDILLYRDGLYEYLDEAYRKHGYAVLGPMILSGDGSYFTSPISFCEHWASREEVESAIRVDELNRVLTHLYIKKPFRWFYHKFIRCETIDAARYCRQALDVCPHGSFLAFSRTYQERFPNGLDDRTFMYGEERLMHLHVLQAGLHTLYDPSYSVYHRENASTDLSFQKEKTKTLFFLNNNIDSARLYLEVLDTYENEIPARSAEMTSSPAED